MKWVLNKGDDYLVRPACLDTPPAEMDGQRLLTMRRLTPTRNWSYKLHEGLYHPREPKALVKVSHHKPKYSPLPWEGAQSQLLIRRKSLWDQRVFVCPQCVLAMSLKALTKDTASEITDWIYPDTEQSLCQCWHSGSIPSSSGTAGEKQNHQKRVEKRVLWFQKSSALDP